MKLHETLFIGFLLLVGLSFCGLIAYTEISSYYDAKSIWYHNTQALVNGIFYIVVGGALTWFIIAINIKPKKDA